MKNRLFIGLSCLCSLLLGGLLRSALPTASAQSAVPAPAQAGRYSIGATGNSVYFADSQTGRVWAYYTGIAVNEKGDFEKPAWQEMPSPVAGTSQKP